MGFAIKSIRKSFLVIFLILITTFMVSPIVKTKSVDYFFTIKGIYADYNEMSIFATHYKDQLAKIGINLELEGLDIFDYIDQKYYIHDYDLIFGLFDESDYNDSTNTAIGYDITLDYDSLLGTGKNQWYLDTFEAMFPIDSVERKEFFHEWQDYLMDEIVPLTPLLAASYKTAYWDNLLGYNGSRRGVIQSLGNIQFDSLHPGQQNTSELILSEFYGPSINPIKLYSASIEYPLQAAFDPLVWMDNYNNYWPHIATNWVHINNTHIRFTIREDIKWNIDPDGLFPSEFLDTKDIYFSLFCYRNISDENWRYDYLKDFKIINDTTIDIYFDGQPNTPENEIYNDYMYLLSTMSIVPEHYLNQTQLGDGVTPDDSHPSWLNFTTNGFGTGPYQLDSFVVNEHRNFTLFEDSWRLNPDLLQDDSLNWKNRFGDIWAIKKLCIIDLSGIQNEIDSLLSGTLDIIEDLESESFYGQIPLVSSFELVDYAFVGGVDVGFNIREERAIIGNREACSINENISKGLAARKAISYAIKIDKLNYDVFDGYATRNLYPIPMGMYSWCSPTITQYGYNFEELAYYMKLLGFEVANPYVISEIVGLPMFVIFIGVQFLFVIFINLNRKKKHFKKVVNNLR